MSDITVQSEQERATSRRVGALGELWPFLRPYKLLLIAAIAALIFTAGISLVLPIAVSRVIDNINIEEG